MTARALLTTAIISYRKNRCNNRLLFGQPILRVRRSWHRELLAFEPGQLFAYERWRANHFGTQEWRIAVCRTGNTGPVTVFPGISPGIVLLLDANGKTRAKRALDAFDALKADTSKSLHDIPEHDWRMLANDIETGSKIQSRGGDI